MSFKRSLLLAAGFALTSIGLIGLFSTSPSNAAIDDVQRTQWGLATFGQSNAIANFSALGWAVEEVNGIVYAGGNFLDVTNGNQTERQPYLAAFSVNSGVWHEAFAPDVGGPVLALERGPGGSLFVGGEMGDWNGQSLGALVKIDPVTGNPWPGWNTRVYGGTSVVRDLSLGPDGWLYVGGTFTTASDSGNPQSVANVIRVDPDTGAIDWTWIPETDGGAVWGVSASYTQPTVYIAGWGNVMNGEQVIGINSTDPSQVMWSGFQMNYGCCNHMYDVQATPHGTVLAVGEQHGAYLYDESDNMAQIIGHVTSYDSRYQASSSRRGGDYQDIELVGDTLYASCHCWGSHSTGIGYTPQYRSNIALVGGTHTGLVSGVIAYDAATGVRDQSFNPYMAGDIGGWGVLEASDGCLWIAGGFNAVGPPGNQTAGRDLVRLCDEGFVPQAGIDPPASCLASFSGDTITISWDAVVGASDYVVYRTADGGNQNWRGRTVDLTFTDTNRDADLVYYVAARDAQGDATDRTLCTSEIVTPPAPTPLLPPANCTATITGNTVSVAWDAAVEATEYVVYRSVDGGNQYWRGVTSDLVFADSNRDAPLIYYVASKSPDRERSERGICTTIDDDGGDAQPVVVDPVDACTVTVVNAPNEVLIEWDAVDAIGAQYIAYRSVDGGNWFWRGKTNDTSFGDTLRAGSIEYGVDVKVGSQKSERTFCTPQVQGN